MHVTLEKLPKSSFKLVIELTPEDLEKYSVLAVKKLNETLTIPGFRPGHIPREILIQRLGESSFQDEVVDTALPSSYADAVINEKLDVVARPEIKIVSRKPLKFEAVVAVMPEIDLGDYKEITIPTNKVEVQQKDMDEEFLAIQRQFSTYNPVKRPVKKGDRVEIDFEGLDSDGKRIQGTHSKNHPVIVGNNALYPEFEEQLVGLSAGEKKEFSIQFAKDYYHSSLQGKKVAFRVTVNLVEEILLPEINGEFIKKYSRDYYGKEMSEDEFKDALKKNVMAEKKADERRRLENELVETLLKRAKVEIPNALIDQEVERMKEELKKQKKTSKVPDDKILQERAVRQVTLELILKHIVSKEKLAVSKDEIDLHKELLINSYPESERENFRNSLRTNDSLIRNISFTLLMGKFYNLFLEEKTEK